MTTTEQRERVVAALTPEVREDLKAKALKASNGPWTREGDGARALLRDAGLMILAVRHRIPAALHEANFDFIAAANPSTILAYEAALEEAEAAEDLANGAVQACRDACKAIMGGNASFVDDDVARALLSVKERAETAEQALSAQQQENERLREAAPSPKRLLWAVHTRGADDIDPATSYEDAVKSCDFMLALDRDNVENEHWPMASALPVIWPGTPEEHAAALAKLGIKPALQAPQSQGGEGNA
ncbi:hypothetical protein [Caulobacter segnis]